MNKSQLVDAVAQRADIPMSTARQVIDATLVAITDALSQGDSVALPGFGTFNCKDRAARSGRNPSTGAEIAIPAARVPSFKSGAHLKAAVSGK